MLWEVDIYPAPGQPNRAALSVRGDAADLHLADDLDVVAAYGYLIETGATGDEVRRAANGLLADRVVETTVVAPVGDPVLSASTRRSDDARACATQAGRDGPGGPKRSGGAGRYWRHGRSGPHAEKVLVRIADRG